LNFTFAENFNLDSRISCNECELNAVLIFNCAFEWIFIRRVWEFRIEIGFMEGWGIQDQATKPMKIEKALATF
jgi:hypothetical protein